MLVYDVRTAEKLDCTPNSEFGYRHKNGRKLSSYSKGACRHSLFVKGYPDGSVLLWDFRNVKVRHKGLGVGLSFTISPQQPILKSDTRVQIPIMHTAFLPGENLRILAYGGDTLSFFDKEMKLVV